MKNEFYVYFLIDSRNSEIFYVGRGKDKRAWVHLRRSMQKELSPKNTRIKEIINSNGTVEVLIAYNNLSFQESVDKEKEIIKNLQKKYLTNRNAGGQGLGSGAKGFLGKTHTLETRKLLSESKKGENNPMYGNKWRRSEKGILSFKEKSSGENHHLFNKSQSEETKRKISNTLKGTQLSEDQKKQRRINMEDVWKKRRMGILPMPKH